MANRQRGEIEAMLDGRRRTLRLTLGALAELEDALGAGDLAGLADRLAGGRLSARDVIAVIGAGLRGAGEAASDAEVAAMTADGGLRGAVLVVAELIAAAFGGETRR
jgi:hypothetical protein